MLLYSRNGKFIKKLGQRGQGPEEYIRIDDLAVDESNEIVYVLSQNNGKILKYSFKGRFLGAINFSSPVDKIVVSPAGQLLMHFQNLTGDLLYSCLLLNHKGDTVSKLKNYIFYEFKNNRKWWDDEGLCYVSNIQIHIKSKGDTLFVVENDRFLPKYVFYTGENLSNKMTQSEYDEKLRFEYLFETDGKVIFKFRFENKWYRVYYDKRQAKAFTSNESAIINDIDDTRNGLFKIGRSDLLSFDFLYSDYQWNNEIIMRRNSALDLDFLKTRVSASKYLEITEMLEHIMKDDDDPVILSLLHLKQ